MKMTYAQATTYGPKSEARSNPRWGSKKQGVKKERQDNMAEEWKGHTYNERENWLHRNMVGIIKNMELISSLQEAFIVEYFQSI